MPFISFLGLFPALGRAVRVVTIRLHEFAQVSILDKFLNIIIYYLTLFGQMPIIAMVRIGIFRA